MKPVMPGKTDYVTANSAQYQVLLPLLYFEIFSYPLTFEEICAFCPSGHQDKTQLQAGLNKMVDNGHLYKIEHFYLTQDKTEWVSTRKDNNRRAEKYLQKARMMTRLIRRFPFVRAVLVSGSLSKKVMPEDGDIDYFIITHPKRLWIARTFLVLFKKLFLLNSKKYFCVNYFVDELHLEIEEQNRFTATEVATLLPIYSQQHYDHFYQANQWVNKFYPNYPKQVVEEISTQKASKIQAALEFTMGGSFGERLDNWFMQRTIAFWNRKFEMMTPENFAVALKSRKYVSKHHPQNFQTKVKIAFQERVKHFEERNNMQLEPVPFSL